ncbi:MAG TPA: glycerol-3-phosphate 1-O-acyltransferase PlsY [Alphaproteobacteria bacterium]|nr:glycerol-3-phosphate 1-O-acyltransferase PlsY [Alphaproteobacteria bacterium]
MPSPLGNFTYTWPFLAAAVAGYLLGSIPFGLLLTRLAGMGDIRKIGSGNIGATNVLRTGNRALAALTLLLDGGKGAAAVLLGARFGPDTAVLAGAGALVGHLFPLWLRFKGGKGVATGLGVLLAAAFPAGLAACATWLAVAFLFRYSSLAALASFALSPLYGWLLGDPQIAQLAAFVAVLVFLRHLGNIRRLLKGEEPKIGAKK